MEILFDITATERVTYRQIILDYLIYVQLINEDEAEEKADIYLANLIAGLDFEGQNVPVNQARYFDTLLSKQTGKHYNPTKAVRNKHPRLAKAKKASAKKDKDNNYGSFTPVDVERTQRIKDDLLLEYSSLSRGDLREDVENYCRLKVVIHNLTDTAEMDKETSVTVKNLMDAQIRLGNYLGIDEGRRQKAKELADRQSIAALSVEFQETLETYPELQEQFVYEEVRILLERYDRNELERELFESPSYANMSVGRAREFVAKREEQYEQGAINR